VGLFASYFFPGLGFLVVAWLSWRYHPRHMARTRRQMVHYLRLPMSPEPSDWEVKVSKIGAAGVPGLMGLILIISAIVILVKL
jgi:hypothetical protein